MSRLFGGITLQLRSTQGTGSFYVIKDRHYDDLKDKLDRNETGWIELDHIHGDAKLFCKLENITEMFLMTEAWAKEADEYDRQEKVEELSGGS